MKKNLISAAILIFIFVSCDSDKKVDATGVMIMPEVHTQVGLTTELTAVIFPYDATNKNVSWKSSDTEIVTVNDGKVTAVALGDAEIIVTTVDGGHTDTSLYRVFPFFENGCNERISGTNFFGGGTAPTTTNTRFNPQARQDTIGNQIWSPPVLGCARGTVTNNFTGITSAEGGSYNADCRPTAMGAATIEGTLFSWCAVVRFADILCPPSGGWRIPSAEDFAALDRAIRGYGSGQEFYVSPEVVEKYRTLWANQTSTQFPNGGMFSGMILTGAGVSATPALNRTGIVGRGAYGTYWSSTEYNATGAVFFYIGATGTIHPNQAGVKSAGRAVRCVRDIQ
jgi:uncharacterized protein (TIGR02145 family)